MNIFSNGLNYLKNLFSNKEDSKEIKTENQTAQTTPTGFFTTKAIDPNYLKANNIDPALNEQLLKRGVDQTEINDYFKSPTAPEILKEEGKAIVQGTKEFAKDQYKQTKESLPYVGEAIKELPAKQVTADWWKGLASDLGTTATNVLSTINNLSPTFGIDAIKKQKEKNKQMYSTTKDLISVSDAGDTQTQKIAKGGGAVTGEFIKYALIDSAFKAILSPLAKTKITTNPKLVASKFEDAAMKADMNGLTDIATKLRKAKTAIPATLDKQVQLMTSITKDAKNLNFKKQLLGGISELVNYSSKRMLKEAVADKAVGSLYNIVKELPQAAKIAANIGSFVAIGQIDYKPGEESRYEQALKDLAIGASFEGAAVLVKKLSPIAKTIYQDIKSGAKVSLQEAELLAKELRSNEAGFSKLPGKADDLAQDINKIKNKETEVPSSAYNINLNRLKMTPEQKISYEANIEKLKPQLELAKGKTLTNEEVLEAAKESDLMTKVFTREETAEQLAQITKSRQRVAELSDLIEKTEDLPTKAKLIQEQMELSKVISAVAADTGRTLQSFNIVAEGVDGVRQSILKRLTKITADTEDLAKKASEVDWTNQGDVNRFYREYVNPTFREVFDEFRYNNMLSNPRTFERNLISSLFSSAVVRPTTKFVEAGVDFFASKLTGKQREVFFKEVPTYFKSFFGSIPEAWGSFIDVWKGSASLTNKDLKLVTGRGGIEGFLKNKLKLSENVSRKVANIFNIPTKALESVDQLLMKMVSEGELAALRKRGVSELKAVKQANEIAKYSLFRAGLDTTDKAGQGKLLSIIDTGIQSVDQLRSSKFGKTLLMDWFVPFIRTPMNFAKQWLEYSPFGLFTLPGSANKKAQIAKTLIGSTIVGLGAQKAFNDETTWGVPNDPTERELFFASGKKPYAVKIGENWIPMMYLGPWAYALALPAAFKYYQQDNKQALTDDQVSKISKAVGSMGEFLSQQTFLEGIGNFVDTIKNDPKQSIEKTLGFTAGQTVPWQGLVRYISTIVDDVYRKSNTFLESMQKDLPFLSKKLEPYRLPTGEEATRNMSSYVAPYDITKEKPEYSALLDQRTEQLQINDLLSSNDDKLNKEAMKIVVTITETKSKSELKSAIEKITGNKQLKNTVESLLKKQAMYTSATVEPLRMFSNNPSAIADIIYGRILLAETKTQLKENVIEFIKELTENNLYNDKVKAALTRLILKESEQDEVEE